MSLSFGEGFATALAAMTFEPDAKYVDTFFGQAWVQRWFCHGC